MISAPKQSNSNICQLGLQSCLEPLILEPRVLMHQSVVSPKSISLSSSSSSSSEGGWNLIQALTTQHKSTNENVDLNSVFVHPLAKQRSTASSISLEMCTETVGNENGSYIDSSLDEYSYLMLLSETKQSNCCSRVAIKKIKPNFPPPLTNSCGGVQMRAHREGGRLVIKSVVVVSSCFTAERENGRLTLSLPMIKGDYYNWDYANKQHQNEEEQVEEKKHNNKEEQVGRRRSIVGDQWGRCMIGGNNKRIPTLPFCVAIS